MPFRDYLRLLLRDRGITNTELARRLNISRQTVSNWMRNPLQMSVADVSSVAVELDLNREQMAMVFEKIINAYTQREVSKNDN